METMGHANAAELIGQAQVTIVGRIGLGSEGENRIRSSVEDADVPALFEEGRQKLVKVEDSNSACCIDGRCAACTAATALQEAEPETIDTMLERVPIRPHVAGGTYHFATLMAIAANLPLVANAKTYDEAKQLVSAFLTENKVSDSIHTTVGALRNPDATGCGAMDAAEAGITKANSESDEYDKNGTVSPICDTMATLHGYKTGQELLEQDELYNEVRHNLVNAGKHQIMAGYKSAMQRDAMLRSHPDAVEVLIGKHVEQGIAINEIEDTTIDRDDNDGRLFIYDRWFARKLARILDPSEHGQDRLLRAADYVTLLITDQLVAPGQPVGVYTLAV